jgi:FMN phosphatase YigB (HAD superfamily)
MHNQWQNVIFIDLDDTIIKGPFESIIFPIVFNELSRKTGLEIKFIRRETIRENFERQTNPKVPASLAMDWDDIMNTVAKRLGVKLESNVLELVNKNASSSVLLENAYEVLRKLALPHRAIVASTKGLRRYQSPILKALGLTYLFTDIITPDTNNALKRSIEFYGKWVELTKLQISVGDHYEDDILFPRKFGFKTIWKPTGKDNADISNDPFVRPYEFNYPGGDCVRPDAIILSLNELPSVVESLEEQASRAYY